PRRLVRFLTRLVFGYHGAMNCVHPAGAPGCATSPDPAPSPIGPAGLPRSAVRDELVGLRGRDERLASPSGVVTSNVLTILSRVRSDGASHIRRACSWPPSAAASGYTRACRRSW